MSDELNPYPGNLKQHKVDPLMPDDPYLTELRKALEPMELEMDTAKQFLLLAGERDALLVARAKDAKLIQQLVDALGFIDSYSEHPDLSKEGAILESVASVISAAAAAGFKPSNE